MISTNKINVINFVTMLFFAGVAFSQPSDTSTQLKPTPQQNITRKSKPANRIKHDQKNKLRTKQLNQPVTTDLTFPKEIKIGNATMTINKTSDDNHGTVTYTIQTTTNEGRSYGRTIAVFTNHPGFYTVSGTITGSDNLMPVGTTYQETISIHSSGGGILTGTTSTDWSYQVMLTPIKSPSGDPTGEYQIVVSYTSPEGSQQTFIKYISFSDNTESASNNSELFTFLDIPTMISENEI